MIYQCQCHAGDTHMYTYGDFNDKVPGTSETFQDPQRCTCGSVQVNQCSQEQLDRILFWYDFV